MRSNALLLYRKTHKMQLKNLIASLAFAASTAVAAPKNLTLEQQLELATNGIERVDILAEQGGNESFVFDFNKPPKAAIAQNVTSGSVVTAVGASFPALIGSDAAMYVFKLGPCGMIVPHSHTRADEFVITTEGEIFTQFLTESESQVITNTLSEYQSSLFPMGSFHFEMNPTCKPATFIGNFNSNDPGNTFVAPNFFSQDDKAVLAQLGGVVSGKDLASIRDKLPEGPVASVEQCLKKCGINENEKRDLAYLL